MSKILERFFLKSEIMFYIRRVYIFFSKILREGKMDPHEPFFMMIDTI